MELDKKDIQGLLVRGYKRLKEASYSLLRFSDAVQARKYLQLVAGQITSAEREPDDYAVHFAFTYPGLMKLDLPGELLQSFSRQFKEGMTEPARQVVLGDVAANAPDHWIWGNWKSDSDEKVIHGMLMLFAKNKQVLSDKYTEAQQQYAQYGVSEVILLPTEHSPQGREHFGFMDGLSQPTVKGFSNRKDPRPENEVNAGEFVLGYENQYGQIPDSPFVYSVGDPNYILPDKELSLGARDFGKNGSYLVFRQMSQDVVGFWKYLKEQSREEGSTTEETAIHLGAKMVGRWPDGKPLVKNPDPSDVSQNNFNFWKDDPLGTKCPVGAHIRRANPRDYLVTVKNVNQNEAVRKTSVEMIQKHRILRRGRIYGKPLAASMEPADLMQAVPDHEDRGLYFICFAGDLIRQYEFIQNAWMKFHKFGGLNNDSDPIAGTRNLHGDEGETISADEFAVPAEPVRRRYCGMPQFTTVRGGAYFFFPGIKAFTFLSS